MKVVCQYCGNDAEFVKGDVIYPHRKDLHALKFYRCEPCGAYVGVHRRNKKMGFNGDEPKGILANAELRAAKIRAHAAFDPLWMQGSMDRTEAYLWLADKLCISIYDCHIGQFNIDQCNKVAEICGASKVWSPPPLTDEEKKQQDDYISLHGLPF